MRQKQVQNEMKASGKMRRNMQSQLRPAKRHTKLKTSEVQRRRLLKDMSVNKDHQKFTEVHKSTKPRRQSTTDLSLSRRWSNKLQKGDDSVKKCVLPTSQKPSGNQSTEKSTSEVQQVDQDSTEAVYQERR